MRPTRDEWGLALAATVATRSPCVRRQVGAVLIDHNGRVAGCGYNGPPRGCPHPTESGANQCIRIGRESGADGPACCLHAETNALDDAVHGRRAGGTLYCTDSPCLGCAQVIVQAGVKRVVVAAQYPNQSGWGYLLQMGVQVQIGGTPEKSF